MVSKSLPSGQEDHDQTALPVEPSSGVKVQAWQNNNTNPLLKRYALDIIQTLCCSSKIERGLG